MTDITVDVVSENINIPVDLSTQIGTFNYNELENKPSINGVELIGNKTTSDLGIEVDTSNFALKSELPTKTSQLENDSEFVDTKQVQQMLADLPKFSISIVDSLPETGQQMILYLVPKDGEGSDVYNEYIWIDSTSSFEFLGSTAVDLTGYVKNTDYATVNVAGVIKSSTYYGTAVQGDGKLYCVNWSLAQYQSADRSSFIGKGTLENAKNDIVKRAITSNDITLTDEEKASAQSWLGITDLIGNIETALAEV